LEENPTLKVNLRNPEADVSLEVRYDAVYVYSRVIRGAGGLPLGTGGKALLLLSGGIDSPVAAWQVMKRGVRLEAIHFYSYPYTSERAKEKVVDLARIIAGYGGEIKVHFVPFTKIQEFISANCRENLWITLMRRFMFRIAAKMATERGALALATGESIGQVASQTLESMVAINDVVRIPVLRPLISLDKEDIVVQARKIGTFDVSIRPYEDCCTVFLPKEPKTRPRISDCEQEESKLDLDALIAEALENTDTVVVKAAEKDEFNFFN